MTWSCLTEVGGEGEVWLACALAMSCTENLLRQEGHSCLRCRIMLGEVCIRGAGHANLHADRGEILVR